MVAESVASFDSSEDPQERIEQIARKCDDLQLENNMLLNYLQRHQSKVDAIDLQEPGQKRSRSRRGMPGCGVSCLML